MFKGLGRKNKISGEEKKNIIVVLSAEKKFIRIKVYKNIQFGGLDKFLFNGFEYIFISLNISYFDI